MGQKINTNLIRLLLNPSYISKWYAKKNDYSLLVKEDNLARFETNNFFKKFLFISKIKILRLKYYNKIKKETIILKINSLFPKWKEILAIIKTYSDNKIDFVKDCKKNYKKNNLKFLFILFLLKKSRILIKYLSKKFNKIYLISFSFIKNRFTDANLVASYIGTLIKKGMKITRAIKETLKKIDSLNLKINVKISVSGCIGKTDRARTEKYRLGTLPLNTFSSNINFCHEEVKTEKGIVNINVHLRIN